jgi:hypothetical protein
MTGRAFRKISSQDAIRISVALSFVGLLDCLATPANDPRPNIAPGHSLDSALRKGKFMGAASGAPSEQRASNARSWVWPPARSTQNSIKYLYG